MAESAPKQPTARPRRRWRRRLAILLILVVVLVVLAPLALALPFVRNMVADAAGEALNREVTIESASAFWFKGIDLEGIEVRSPEGFDEPLATVKSVHVDLDLLALLSGGVDADVRIESPRVTFLEDGAGRSNTDGLFGKNDTLSEDEPEPRPEATSDDEDDRPRLGLEVIDGVVRARRAPNAAFEEVKNLALTMTLDEDGGIALELGADAVGAAAGGGDAHLEVDTRLSAAGEGPLKATVPPVDLSRLAAIVEGATGYEGLRGTFSLDADATLHAGQGASGTIRSEAQGFVLRSPEGPRLAAQRMTASLEMETEEGTTAGNLTVRIEHVELLDETPRRFREPLITISATARYDETKKLLLVEKGGVNAGQALAVTVSKPWEIHTGAEPHANGELVIQADLGRLSNLKAFVPALAQVRRGGFGARITAEAKDGLNVRAGIRVKNLELAPGDLSPSGFLEPEMIAYASLTRAKGEGDVPLSVVLPSITSSFLTVGPVKGSPPLEIRIAEAGIGATGSSAITLHLASLGRAFGGAMGLEPGDQLGGTFTVVAKADLTPDAGTTTLSLLGKQVTLPDRWAEGVPPAAIEGRILLETTAARLTIDVPTLEAFGLIAKAAVAMGRGEGGGLETVDASLTGDLGRARGLLAPLLGLQPTEQLAGRLDASTKMVVEGDAKRLHGRTTVAGLRWQDRTRQVILDEPKVELTHDVTLADEGRRTVIRTFQLTSSALEARVEGSAVEAGDDTSLDAKVTLGGDAARLAGILRRRLGEDYRDLVGRGRLAGNLTLTGSTGQGGRSLLVNGTVSPGAWSTGGLSLSKATLKLARAAAGQPQGVQFDAAVNQGTFDLDLTVTPSPRDVPWTMSLKVARVDTAPVAVSQGLGEYLTYFLPTLVPSDAGTQVLSGLLDADIEMRAAATEQPRLDQTLAGKGFIAMNQGAIGESTLFKSLGGGRGLGEVGSVLARAVPEVGQALASLQRSLTFSHLESRFVVANRVVNITKGLLDGERTRIDFSGPVGFNESVNLKMDLTLAGKAGERLARVMPTKKSTIPMTVTGNLSNPNVKPNLDAASLAGGALGGLIPRGDPKDALDRLKDLLPK